MMLGTKMRLPLIVAFFVLATPAFPQALRYKALVENMAALSVAAKWCDDYQVDMRGAISMLIENKVNIAKPPYEKIFDETKEKLEKIMGDSGVGRFCSVTFERYRPGGEVPGFMMKK